MALKQLCLFSTTHDLKVLIPLSTALNGLIFIQWLGHGPHCVYISCFSFLDWFSLICHLQTNCCLWSTCQGTLSSARGWWRNKKNYLHENIEMQKPPFTWWRFKAPSPPPTTAMCFSPGTSGVTYVTTNLPVSPDANQMPHPGTHTGLFVCFTWGLGPFFSPGWTRTHIQMNIRLHQSYALLN